MSEVNPYAPPASEDNATAEPRKRRKKGTKNAIAKALAELDEHLSDPQKVAADLKASGARARTVTFVLLGLGGAGLFVALLSGSSARSEMRIAGISLGAIFLFIGIVALVVDLSLVSRKTPGSPEATLKSFIKSIGLGRYGYAWASLAPNARAQTIPAPNLAPVASGVGDFSLDTEAGMKGYAATFARPGGGTMRGMQIKNIAVIEQDEDVAVVGAQMVFQSWPQWANILLGAGGVFAARIGNAAGGVVAMIGLAAAAAGLIGLLVLRKSTTVFVRRTLLRGRNGVWYFYDGDVVEGADRNNE